MACVYGWGSISRVLKVFWSSKALVAVCSCSLCRPPPSILLKGAEVNFLLQCIDHHKQSWHNLHDIHVLPAIHECSEGSSIQDLSSDSNNHRLWHNYSCTGSSLYLASQKTLTQSAWHLFVYDGWSVQVLSDAMKLCEKEAHVKSARKWKSPFAIRMPTAACQHWQPWQRLQTQRHCCWGWVCVSTENHHKWLSRRLHHTHTHTPHTSK